MNGNVSTELRDLLRLSPAIAITINLMVGLPMNSYVMHLIITGTGSGVVAEIFTLNLTLCEILSCITSPLIILKWFAFENSLLNVSTFLMSFLASARPLFLSCICVERYLAVLHPLIFLRLRPLRYRLVFSVVAWMIILCPCTSAVWLNPSMWHIWATVDLPLFLIKLYCCLALLRALKQLGPGRGAQEREGANQAKLRAFRIISIILVGELLTYSPLVAVFMIQNYLNPSELRRSGSFIFSLMVLTGFTQPVLFLQRVGKLPRLPHRRNLTSYSANKEQ